MSTERGTPGRSGGRVLCCGTFDHVHPGHESFLRQAAALGTELYVVVARDENVERMKGRRPDHDERQRQQHVQALGVATEVRLGHPGKDFLRVVAEVQPHVIALGYDQVAPPGLANAFPECRIIILEPHEPERFKSSILRRRRAAG